MPPDELRVIFRTAAGARRGYGHLVRCLTLARALGVRPLVSLRGGATVLDTALALGADVVTDPSSRVLLALRPDVVVVDDPITRAAKQWVTAARRIGALVVTVHDLGIGCREGDLVIDGSITRARKGVVGSAARLGPRFAVLNPAVGTRLRRGRSARPNVLIALGGGPRARAAAAIAAVIAAAHPTASVRIAGGFEARPQPATGRVTWLGTRPSLVTEIARADVAVVGGGLTLYEACALGVPTVGVPVVAAQVPTVRTFARSGAALGVTYPVVPRAAAGQALRLLNDGTLCRTLAFRARQVVDGRGAQRAAAAVATLAKGARS